MGEFCGWLPLPPSPGSSSVCGGNLQGRRTGAGAGAQFFFFARPGRFPMAIDVGPWLLNVFQQVSVGSTGRVPPTRKGTRVSCLDSDKQTRRGASLPAEWQWIRPSSDSTRSIRDMKSRRIHCFPYHRVGGCHPSEVLSRMVEPSSAKRSAR